MSSVFGSTEARHAGTAPKYISAAMQPTLYASKESSSSHDGDDERAGKKRRLTVEQARLLEMSFEREKKLQQHRKFQLAVELGLKPRQVAVWYQNRRARWKAKQLEQEYDILKQRYEQVLLEKQKLEAEVIRLAVELQMDERQMKEENITSGRTYGTEEDETWNKTSSICSDGPAKPYKELAGQRSDNEQAVPQPKQGTHRLQRHLLQNQVSPGDAEHSKRNDYRLIAAKSGDNNENMVSQQLYNSDLMAVAGQQVITAGCLDWFNF